MNNYNYTPGVYQPMSPNSKFGQMGKNYWKNELQNMLGIQSGAMQPTDLPEFKGMANQYNAQSNQAMNRTLQQLGQRGITGGAAAGAVSNAQDNNMAGLLKMIQGIYQNANQRGAQAANQGVNWEQFLSNRNLAYNNMSQDWQKWQQQLAMMWQKMHDARMGQGSDISGIIKGLLASMQTMGGGAGGSGGGSEGMGNYGMDWGSAWSDPNFGGSFAEGGTIDEPVIGQGLHSGQTYTFAENGPETVLPNNQGNVMAQLATMMGLKNNGKDNGDKMFYAEMNSRDKPKLSEGAGNAQSITQGLGGIAKLIAAYYTGNYGLAKSGGKDLMGAASTQLEK